VQSIDGFIAGPPPVRPRMQPEQLRPQPVRPVANIEARQRLQPTMQPLQRPVQPPVAPIAPPERRLPQLDMELPESSAPAVHHDAKFTKHSKWRTFRVWTLRASVAMIVLVLGVGGFLFSQGYLKLHKVFKGSAAHAAALQANVDPNLLKGEGDGRINVLLLGIGGANHDGSDLTDTMMLASIDPVNKTSVLLSMPRDLWVNMPNAGAMKINAAYETGKYKYLGKINADNSNSKAIEAGFSSVDQTVENVLGVPIHYNLLLDFQAFKQAVNTLGGVDVNVPEQLYDPTMAWENKGNPVLAKAGLQHFDGTHALIYVRSRETSSDFARGQRQRSVMLALKEKAETLGTLSNPSKISGLISAFGNNVLTDLSLGDASRLYSITKDIANNNVQSLDLDTAPNVYITTAPVGNISTVQPKAGMFNFKDIQTFVRSRLQDGYLKRENAKVMVLNGTTVAGLATSKAAELKSYGYNVGKVASAPTSGYDQTVVVDLTHGKDKYTKHYLEQRFNTTATSKLPDNAIVPGDAQFIIVLGNDSTSSIQD